MISVENVSFTYAGAATPSLDKVNLHVAQGDFLGIIGPSGAGKTTLACAMNGAIPHCHTGDFYGAVRVAGMDTFEHSLTDISKAVGTVFQDIDASMVAGVVEDEVLFGLENFGYDEQSAYRRVDEALNMLGIAHLRSALIASLSGGQRQKVACAAVLALQPDVLVLDEPTGALDPVSSAAVFEILAQLNGRGTTVVVIEQKIGLLATYARSLAVMESGRCLLQGATRDVLSHADELRACGVNVPRVVDLSIELAKDGFGDGRMCTSVVEACGLVEELIA